MDVAYKALLNGLIWPDERMYSSPKFSKSVFDLSDPHAHVHQKLWSKKASPCTIPSTVPFPQAR